MTISPADALAAVERSPAAVALHDRDAWVGVFTADGVVEDPVGSQAHRGTTALTAFYDTFIGPRDITFHRDVDLVAGSTVIRDLDLEVGMAAGLVMRIPAYLRYEVTDRFGELKISALQAYWELPAMVGQFLRSGPRSIPAGVQLSSGLLRNQGAAGALGFLAGFRGAGAQGKRQFVEFLTDATAGDEVAIRRRLGGGARITAGDDTAMSSVDLLSRVAGAAPHKVIAAGYHLVAGLDRDGGRDILIADVTTRPFTITRLRFYAHR